MTSTGGVRVLGAAMTRFGRLSGSTARDLVEHAVAGAIRDAGVPAGDVQAVFVGNSLAGLISGQESIRGQVALRRTGLLGVPVFNLESACASGSIAVHAAWQGVVNGAYDCVLAVGFEKMNVGSKSVVFRAFDATMDIDEVEATFPDRSPDRSVYMDHYAQGADQRADKETLAAIASKNHHHGSLNPLAQYRFASSVSEVLASRPIVGDLTLFMCAPLSDGAAAVVLGSEAFNARTRRSRVRVAASVAVSGRGDDAPEPAAVPRAVDCVYEASGISPSELDMAEIHDATAAGELELYSQIGLCRPGDEAALVSSGALGLGGRVVVNPSGGLIARGHPLGATGVAQLVEAFWQLEGRAGDRQIPNARVALTQNVGGWLGEDHASATAHVLMT